MGGTEQLAQVTRLQAAAAHDGVQALDAAATFRPEVVLLDIGLPKLKGIEVARRIRQQPWGEKIVLVALTGWVKDEDRDQSRAAGFNSHWTKPVEPSLLLKMLAEFPSIEGFQ